MAKQPVEVIVTTSGFFFRGNPVGSVHMSLYDALEEMAEVGASAAASQLTPGHGLLPYPHTVYLPGGRRAEVQAGALQASIEPRLVHAGRLAIFRGRAYVIQGARGFEPVRLYGRKIDRKYRYMYRAAAAAQAFANGQAATWAARTARWLSAA